MGLRPRIPPPHLRVPLLTKKWLPSNTFVPKRTSKTNAELNVIHDTFKSRVKNLPWNSQVLCTSKLMDGSAVPPILVCSMSRSRFGQGYFTWKSA